MFYLSKDKGWLYLVETDGYKVYKRITDPLGITHYEYWYRVDKIDKPEELDGPFAKLETLLLI